MTPVTVVGGGLAGSEAALWLAARGVPVLLYEQKPQHFSPAHRAEGLAELVCSNSLKAERLASAGGLLKAEMRLLGSSLLPVAEGCRVPAGGALAVDRDAFSAGVTALVQAQPLIELRRQPLLQLPAQGFAIVAAGPLAEGAIAQAIAEVTGAEALSFYDAAAPIVTAASLDGERAFAASRYGRGEADYLNCPMDKAEYEAFWQALVGAQRAVLHPFDEPGALYEGCMPVEEMARRGPDTLRYGPLRPVGLTDPRTGHRPYANVQLRQENEEGTLYNIVGFQTNLRFGEQKRVFGMVPALAGAEYARYGVMHRNTFLNSPAVLGETLALKKDDRLYFAGQITGFEGYMESAACGLLAARALFCRLRGAAFSPPPAETMCGALLRYVTAPNDDFQPMGANMGLLPPLAERVKGKQQRYEALAARALAAMEGWLAGQPG